MEEPEGVTQQEPIPEAQLADEQRPVTRSGRQSRRPRRLIETMNVSVKAFNAVINLDPDRSIIGQLNYLAATMRPDIQCAVHQCARFCENPRMIHEKAVKRIIRYLKRTRNKGIDMTVDPSKGIECYVDADFAGAYDKNDSSNPRDLLSRMGYVVKYAGCPIIWTSKLASTLPFSRRIVQEKT